MQNREVENGSFDKRFLLAYEKAVMQFPEVPVLQWD